MAKSLFAVFAALLLGICSAPAHAESAAPHKIAVHVVCSCDDAMGKAYVTAFEDALGKDSRYVIDNTSDNEEAMRINIISMQITTAEGQPGDAFSIVCTHNGSMMHQFVTTCAHIPVDDCARHMVNDLGDLA